MSKNYTTRHPAGCTHREPRNYDNRVLTAGWNCPYCRWSQVSSMAVTVIRETNFAHFRCKRCNRVFTVKTPR